MSATVYIETTVFGYLTSWPSKDAIVAGHQKTTNDWWTNAAPQFSLFASQLVSQECSAGDPLAAQDRLKALVGIPLLSTTKEAEQLAAELIAKRAIPAIYPEDALHIALAAVHGIEYLLTWNFKHIANATTRASIERVCRDAGYEPPIICTPEELLQP